MKKFLDEYMAANPEKVIYWKQAGARKKRVDLSEYYQDDIPVCERQDDGNGLTVALVHSVAALHGRRMAMSWAETLNTSFSGGTLRDVRASCSEQNFPIRLSKIPAEEYGTFRRDPLGYLMSGYAIGKVLFVISPGDPQHAFVVDGVCLVVWDGIESHCMELCPEVMEAITRGKVGRPYDISANFVHKVGGERSD